MSIQQNNQLNCIRSTSINLVALLHYYYNLIQSTQEIWLTSMNYLVVLITKYGIVHSKAIGCNQMKIIKEFLVLYVFLFTKKIWAATRKTTTYRVIMNLQQFNRNIWGEPVWDVSRYCNANVSIFNNGECIASLFVSALNCFIPETQRCYRYYGEIRRIVS